MKPAFTRFVILSFFVLFTCISLAQNKFNDGYIVSVTGDTLTGTINYKNWGRSQKSIEFEDAAGKKVSYKPGQIKAFGVGGYVYETAAVSYDRSPVNDDQLNYATELEMIKDTVFLQVLFKGEKSLYAYKDYQLDANLFFIGKKDTIEWLIHKSYFNEDEGKRGIKRINHFRYQLDQYLEKCTAVKSKIENTEYRQQSLERVFKQYYSCVNGTASVSKKEKTKLETGVVAGVSLTTLHFHADQVLSYINKISFKKSTNITAGIYLNAFLFHGLPNLSIYNELLYNSYAVAGEYTDFHHDSYYIKYSSKFAMSYIKLNTMFSHKIPLGKAAVYFRAGMSNGVSTKQVNTVREEKTFYSAFETNDHDFIKSVRKYEMGIIGGAGLQIDRFSFEMRYESGVNIAEAVIANVSAKRIYALAGFRF